MSKPRHIVIFDGDDTLWSTMPLYDIAKQRFAEHVADLVTSRDEAIKRLDVIDHSNVAIMGFSPERFPNSLVEAYRTLCEEAGRVPKSKLEKRLIEEGRRVFSSPVVTYPDADEALSRLDYRFKLVLATKGDMTIQAQRVTQSDLGQYFTDIHIFGKKSKEEFKAILAAHRCEPSLAWSVGNSPRSDINPALKAGMSAVLIPRSTWQFEDEPILQSSRLFVVNTLLEAVDIIIDRTK
jgi:putative hydrolase of the HAD superfamily